MAQAGLLLVGVAAGFALAGNDVVSAATGWDAAWLQLVSTLLALVGVCSALTYVGAAERQVLNAEQLAGLARTDPWSAAMLSVCLLSLAGLPPLAGFWGKLFLLLSAIQVDAGNELPGARNWFVVLSFAAMLSWLVTAGCLIRIVAMLYFRAPRAAVPRQGGLGPWLAMTLCGVLIVWLGLVPSLLWEGISATMPHPNETPSVVRAPREAK